MWFLYAILGAFGKSYSGFFRKRLAGGVSAGTFMWVSYLASVIVLAPIVLTRETPVIDAFTTAPWALIGAAATLMVATYMNLEALKREELSFIAPLNAFVPVFTFIIAAILLDENPPIQGLIGILAIFIGAYIISLKPDRVKWYEPIQHLFTNTGARLSLGVGIGYAVNTVLTKSAINAGLDLVTVMFLVSLIGWVLLIHVPF